MFWETVDSKKEADTSSWSYMKVIDSHARYVNDWCFVVIALFEKQLTKRNESVCYSLSWRCILLFRVNVQLQQRSLSKFISEHRYFDRFFAWAVESLRIRVEKLIILMSNVIDKVRKIKSSSFLTRYLTSLNNFDWASRDSLNRENSYFSFVLNLIRLISKTASRSAPD